MESLNLTKPYRKLVAIRSPYNLGMLERCLAETDPETTEVVVMTASVLPPGSGDLKPTITDQRPPALDGGGQPGRACRQAGQAGDRADQRAVLRHDPHRQDDRRPRADHGPVEQVPPRGPARPGGALLAERVRRQARAAVDPRAGQGPRRAAGHRRRQPDPQGRAPRAAETAQLLAELRKSWHGVERLLLAYDGSPLSADFLDTVVSFLDPAIAVTLLDVAEDDVDARRHRRRPRKPS